MSRPFEAFVLGTSRLPETTGTSDFWQHEVTPLPGSRLAGATMHRIFQRFVDRLSSSPSPDVLHQIMDEAATALGLSCFAYLSVPQRPSAEAHLISNYPSAWTTQYLKSHYERFDPVITRALGHPEPFEWGLEIGSMARSKAERELFEEAAKFGIRHGFTVPIHDYRGPVAAVTFAANDRLPQFERSINEHAKALQLMAMYFHAHARRRIESRQMIHAVSLSPRELECLEWAAQGKSAWEIGRILGISRHTAATHLDNVKTKFGVRTIIQAVARFMASRSTIK
ncbi:LuxR family transcriptional regulator [Bradyrhizobium sp. Bra78]|uniref:LuxR family transcriptional regulator n=1 Tax=Bradyrhizobium sp. Bra78 TaxID=2926010 RepID=UPI002905A98B|nr:LuxR family transcriptional regulator [Bradyrhizobium sp. Bra78]